MHRCLFLFILLLQMSSFTNAYANQKQIRVGIFPFEPINFVDQENKAQGFNPALLKKIAKDQNWNLTFINGTWDEGLERLQSGEIDLVMSAAYSEERAKVMDYTVEASMELWGQVFVKADLSNINISDLSGKRVGVMRNDISGKNFIKTAKNHGVTPLYFEFAGFADVFAAIQKDEIDAGVAPQHYGLRHAKDFNLAPSTIQFAPFSIYFASKKSQHSEILRQIDKTLFLWKKDNHSFYYHQLGYWLGEGAHEHLLPEWFKYSIFTIATTLIILVFNSVWLKLQVKKKTTDLYMSNIALKKSQENYYSIFNNAQVGIMRSSILNGTVIECNNMMANMLGYDSPEECIRKCHTPSHYVDPMLRKAIIHDLKQYGYVEGHEAEIVRCNGEIIWIHFSAKIYSEEGFIETVGIDITEHKLNTIALANREDELFAIYHAAPSLMFVIDSEQRVRKANKAALDFCDYIEEDIIGARLGEIFKCAHAAAASDKCGSALECENCLLRHTVFNAIEKGEFVRGKEESLKVIRGEESQELHFLVSVSTLDLVSNTHIFVCLEDITEIKHVQLALRYSQERFRTLFDKASDSIFLLSKEGRFIDINEHACKSLGYRKEELLNMELADIDTDDCEPYIRDCLSTISNRTSALTMGRVYRCKGGHLLNVEVSASPINIQKRKFILAIARDVTQRKKAEEALLNSEKSYSNLYNQFKTLLDAICDPLVLLSENMETVWSNAAYDQLCNQGDCQKDDQHSELYIDISDLESSASKCFKKGTVIEEVITSSTKGTWGIKVFPLKTEKGDPPLALVIAVDITEKIRLRDEAIKTSRLASLGELAAGVAHEINNPNAVILLNTPIIKDAFSDAEEILADYHRKHGDLTLAGIGYEDIQQELPLLIDRIKDSAERISNIVNELKNFVRDEVHNNHDWVNLNGVIREGVHLLDNRIKNSTDNFSLNLAAGLPLIHGDAQKLGQVLVNLLDNACQALTEQKQAVEVKTFFSQKKSAIVLQVCDHGRGIEMANLSKLTDPFYTTRRSCGGTGLGLSISARILKEHGAHMTVESEPGQGATFSILFPIGQREDRWQHFSQNDQF